MKRNLIEAAVCTATMFACSTLVSAQPKGERTNPARLEQCLQIERRVKAGSRDPMLLTELWGCDDTGPRMLVGKWRELPTDYGTLEALTTSSSVLHDRRLLAHLIGLANDGSMPVLHRSAAIASMVSYLNPGWIPSVSDSETTTRPRIRVVMVDHSNVTVGAEPLTHSDLQSLRQALTDLATKDTSKAIRELASRVAKTRAP